jgi:hypothetical protein
MKDRTFYGMLALALLATALGYVLPKAAIFP